LESTLITEGPNGYAPLAEASDPQSPNVQLALGRFLRAMHHAGAVHHDLHPKNVLYCPRDNSCCLLDVDKIQLRTKVTTAARLENLALLCAWFSLTDAFYEGYADGAIEEAEAVARRAAVIRRQYIAKWSRHCLQHEHEVTRQRVGGLTWYIRQAHRNATLESLLQDPEQTPPRIGEFVVQRLRFWSAKRAYRGLYHQELAGRPAPRPTAVADKHILGVVVRSYLITRGS
jgi:serine/threonine protein kinase